MGKHRNSLTGSEPLELKLCVVGDAGVGKTSLLYSFTHRISSRHFAPSIYPHNIEEVTVDGNTFHISLWDCVAIQNDNRLDKLRSLAYHRTDCFIVCYAVDSRASFEHVETEWIPELREYCPYTAVILVGTKGDIAAEQSGHHIISKPEGAEMATRIKASHFLHCSAKTRECVEQIFEEATRAASFTKFGVRSQEEDPVGGRKCAIL